MDEVLELVLEILELCCASIGCQDQTSRTRRGELMRSKVSEET